MKQTIVAGYQCSLLIDSDDFAWFFGDLHLNYEIPEQFSIKINVPDIVSVATGTSHSLLLDAKGTVWSIGKNSCGELGCGHKNDVSYSNPFQIDYLPEIIAVSCSPYTHSTVLDVDGHVWISGSNSFGLGLGSITATEKFTIIKKLPKIQQICCGFYHSIFLAEDGTVWGIGYNGNGELGQKISTNFMKPTKIEGLPPIIEISTKYVHSLFLDIEGIVWGCGRTSQHQLGAVVAKVDHLPFQILDLPKIQSIGAGFNHSVFLDFENNVWCCGETSYGQCGVGTLEEVEKPTKVEALSDILGVAVGGMHTFFYNAEGLWGCGSNTTGALCLPLEIGNQQIRSPVQISNFHPKINLRGRFYGTKSARKL